MSQKIPETFCALPWVSLETRSEGRVAPCCLSSQCVAKADGSGDFYLYKDSIEDAFFSVHTERLRKNLLNNVADKNCDACWIAEKSGIESKRQRENQRYPEILAQLKNGIAPKAEPIRLDLKLGNLCNLKCRICCPASSSKWTEEFVSLYGSDQLPRNSVELSQMPEEESRQLMMRWTETSPEFWPTLEKWLPNLRGFEFFGGEPFLIKKHFELIETSVKRGFSKRQTLHYNTNGTIYPEHAAQNLFPHFESITVFFSVDGIGSQFEYMRHGAKWDTVLQNIEKFRANTNAYIGVGPTISNFNIYYLPEFLEFWLNKDTPVFLNHLFHPTHFDIRAMPPELKKAVIKKLRSVDPDRFAKILLTDYEGIISYMMSEDRSEYWPTFLLSLSQHDTYRAQSFASTFPEFSALMREIGSASQSLRC